MSTDVGASTAVRRASTFLVFTFGLSLAVYLPVIAATRGWVDVPALTDPWVSGALSIFAICTPGVVALSLHLASDGISGLRDAVDSVTSWRFGRLWWAVTVLLGPLLVAVPYGAYLLLGGPSLPSPVLFLLDQPAGVVVLGVMVGATMLLALGEELGWRGYFLPLLQARFGAAVASLVLGVCWFLWHLPLRFVDGANGGFPLALWGVSIVATAFIYTWLFNNTGGSVLAVTVLHGLLNVSNGLVALQPNVTGELLSAYVIAGTNVLFALVIILVYGTTSFARRRASVLAAPLDD
ncbi:CPBP family intramembrane glutamic endopeptidase [Haloferax sp. CBA1150]|uniref:CPBP family intramembrane glutamic endopeptidase n=1 Tax=Haloferax sp. CBA1150 TaxID=2650754 RepID=UPI001CD95A8D|nr:CPBP family intramembrane glutamic endopeptidase [Haloferax sp. CBA1150]